MEPEGSLPHSQVPATCPYPEPARPSPLAYMFVCVCIYLYVFYLSDSSEIGGGGIRVSRPLDLIVLTRLIMWYWI